MEDIILMKNKIMAAHLQGWSEGYIEGLIAAYKYLEDNKLYVDDEVLNELKQTIKLCGGKLDE